MTTEGKQQEAVCGTCGEPACECGDVRLGAHHLEARYADHDFIPAPVVPSDDERPTLVYLASPYSDPDPSVMERRFEAVCREAAVLMARGIHIYSPIAHTHPIAVRGDLPKDWTFWEAYDRVMLGASSELWVLTLDGYEGSRGVAAEVNIATEMGKPVRYIAPEAAASPTPSQDAEGDGLYRYEESMGARCCITCLALPGEPHADGCHALALVSSIRADYEELVKAARDARSALVLLTSELSGQMGYIEGLQQRPHGQPQRTINYAHDVHAFLTATLTRIEESLGGRS